MDMTIDLAGVLASGLDSRSSLNADLMELDSATLGNLLPFDKPIIRLVTVYPNRDIVVYFHDENGWTRMCVIGKVRQFLKSYPFPQKEVEAAISSPEFSVVDAEKAGLELQELWDKSCNNPLSSP
jgi:hypothetical protein